MSAPSCAASALTGSAGNGEEILEAPQLFARAHADDDVARLEPRLRLRRRVEAAVPLAQRDDDRAGLVADAEVANRLAGVGARVTYFDLRQLEVRARRGHHRVDEGGDLRFE